MGATDPGQGSPSVPRAARDPRWPHGAVLLFATLLLWLPRLEGPIDLRYDAGVYFVLGTSLAEGKGYRLLNEPGEIAAVQYPPLVPAFVAVHEWVMGTRDPYKVGHALRLSYFALCLAYALAAYAMARRFLPPHQALGAAALAILLPHTYFLSDLLFAEIPFALVSTLFVVTNSRRSRASAVLTALLGVGAYLLRTMGLALLVAWVGESLLNRRLRQAALRVAVSLVPVLLWQQHVAAVTSAPEYQRPAYSYQRAPYQYYNVSYAENLRFVDSFRPELGPASPSALVARLAGNARAMLVRLGEGVSVPQNFWWNWFAALRETLGVDAPGWLARVPCVLLTMAIVLGALSLTRRREWLVPLYLAGSVGLACLTPWPQQFTRYLAPLAPFLGVCLLQGGAVPGGKAGSRGRSLLQGGALAVVLACQSYAVATIYSDFHPRVEYLDGTQRRATGRLFFFDRNWRDFESALAWLATQAKPDEIVATSQPHYLYLRAGRRAVMPPMEADAAKAQLLLDSVPVAYLIVDDLEFSDFCRRYADPVVRARSDLWEEAYAAPAGALRVYRRSR